MDHYRCRVREHGIADGKSARRGGRGDPNTDTRGILDPGELQQYVELQRFPVEEPLAGIVDWLWSVHWALPPGRSYRSRVLSHPSVNVSVGDGPPEGAQPPPGPYPTTARVVGVTTRVQVRVLTGSGWNVAAKTTTGGFGALLAGRPGPGAAAPAREPASTAELTDRDVPIDHVLDVDAAALAARMTAGGAAEERAAVLAAVLTRLVTAADPRRVATGREVAAIARSAEVDRSIRSVDALARPAGLSVRTLQRLFAEYAGASPTWVIRRYRLIDAAERVRAGESVVWAEVAAELGYADQAHLTRDFTRALGTTPSAYQQAQRRPR